MENILHSQAQNRCPCMHHTHEYYQYVDTGCPRKKTCFDPIHQEQEGKLKNYRQGFFFSLEQPVVGIKKNTCYDINAETSRSNDFFMVHKALGKKQLKQEWMEK